MPPSSHVEPNDSPLVSEYMLEVEDPIELEYLTACIMDEEKLRVALITSIRQELVCKNASKLHFSAEMHLNFLEPAFSMLLCTNLQYLPSGLQRNICHVG